MKKFLLSLAIVAFAATAMNAQTVQQTTDPVKKECCKDHKDGKKCDKPADQQCPDCKAKAAKQCDKAAMKECSKKDVQAKQCDKAAAEKKDCCKKDAQAKQCDKAAAEKKDCCKNADGKKASRKAKVKGTKKATAKKN